jgi:hypothetical protein
MATRAAWSSVCLLLASGALFVSRGRAAPLPLDARAIQDAVDAAAPGDRIELPEGRVVGELRIDAPITLQGAGRDRTVFASRGHRPALMVLAQEGTVTLEGVSFTTSPKARGHRGTGVVLSGPGEIVLRDVAFRRTITGRCLTSAISLDHEPRVRLERVQIEDHRCYLAGALVVGAGAEVEIVGSLLEDNVGELAGAIYVAGGALRIEGSVLRDNRHARGRGGHHLTFGPGPSRLELVATELSPRGPGSVAFERGATPAVRVARMRWPEPERPAFVRLE